MVTYYSPADYTAGTYYSPTVRISATSPQSYYLPSREAPDFDPFFKIRPVLESVRQECRNISADEYQSVDEQIIPFKGRSSLKQYVPKKPNPRGYKVFSRCSSSGIVHDFAIYAGMKTDLSVSYPSLSQTENIVVSLCHGIRNIGCKVFFDNYYTTLRLLLFLREHLKIFAVGTIRNNRIHSCPLKTEKDLRQTGRGSHDEVVDANSGLVIVRWLDNKPVTIASTYIGAEPTSNKQRWSSKDKKHIDVSCPAIISEYNQFMGGVDLTDMFLQLYRIDRRSTRWYTRIFYFLIGIAINNSWLLTRRNNEKTGTGSKLPLADFIGNVADALAKAGKTPLRRRGRPSRSDAVVDHDIASSSSNREFRPHQDIRSDQVGHWPIHCERGRCKHCVTGTTRWKCQKCSLHLCLNDKNNCFYSFHNP